MRFLLILILLVVTGYLVFGRHGNADAPSTGSQGYLVSTPAGPTSAATPAHSGSNFLKRPLDRAHEALDANRKRVENAP